MRVKIGRNVAANIVNTAVSLAASLVSIPLILDHVGLSGYGVWALAQSVLFYVMTAESGPGTAIQRFVGVRHGGASPEGVATVFWTSLVLYATAGPLVFLLIYLGAPWFVGLFDIPARLEDDAQTMVRLVGAAVMVALVASPFGNVQQGLERFGAYAVATITGVVAFLVALVVLVPEHGLVGLGWTALAQQTGMLVVRVWDVRAETWRRRPRLLRRTEAGEFVSFAFQIQMSALSTLVNNQTDKFVAGLLAPVSTVGQVGIGSQFAETGRILGAAVLSPVSARMAVVAGSPQAEQLPALYERVHRVWSIAVAGGSILGVAALYPLIAGWLGDGYGKAALFGGLLVAAFGFNLMTHVPLFYLRAIGKPRLEARYGFTVIALNLGMTIALGLAFGPVGVVAATTGAYALGTAWFFGRLRRVAPELPQGALAAVAGAVPVACALAAVVLAAGLGAVELIPEGVAVAPIALLTAVAFVAYMALATGVRPTPALARELLG